MRADRYSAVGNVEGAINDIKTTTKLDTDNTAGLFRLAMLYYNLGEAEDSLRCLILILIIKFLKSHSTLSKRVLIFDVSLFKTLLKLVKETK